jgi:hypothetical protein
VANPYRYGKVVLTELQTAQRVTDGSSATAEVTRMRVFKVDRKVQRITRMADCVIQETPEAIAAVQARFSRRTIGRAAYGIADAGSTGTDVPDVQDEAVDTSLIGESSDEYAAEAEPFFEEEGQVTDGDAEVDAAADADPNGWASAIPSRDLAPMAASAAVLRAPAPRMPARGMGNWWCSFVGESQVICDTGAGETWCTWTPGGGSYDVYECDNGCYLILGTFEGGFWCPGDDPIEPPEECEEGEVMSPWGECVCDDGGGGVSNLVPSGTTGIGTDTTLDIREQPDEPGEAEGASESDGSSHDTAEASTAFSDDECGDDDGGSCEDYGTCEPPPQPPAIDVNCTSEVVRGGDVVCTASSNQGTPVLSVWAFEADEAGFDNSFITPPLPLNWNGKMIASGKVIARGKVNGVDATQGELYIKVNPRTNFASEPTIYILEVASALPSNPIQFFELGQTNYHVGLSIPGYDLLEGGPNHGMSYMTSMPVENIAIQINRQAFGSSHAFPMGHTTSGSDGNCPRFRIFDLQDTVVVHEGLGPGPSPRSHAYLYKEYFNTHPIGALVEKIREPTGEITPARLATDLSAVRTAAAAAAALADQPPLIPTLNCTIKWTY